MINFLSSVHAVDLALAVIAIEVITLTLYWHTRSRGIAPAQLLPNVLAGVLLLLALRRRSTGKNA